MATPTPSDKVKDKEYANWLKVTLALYHMKLGLHTFIKNEIDCLHQSLIQNIYGGPTIPPSLPHCTMCLARHVIRNKYTGVWAFPKQCKSYCDVWLYELLLLHTSPKSEKIYWDNSTVTAWTSKPWECAKVFMPRGQPSSNTGPAECDAQALLTLLANCKHFHPKLSSQGLGLKNTISMIRNKIMHDSEMKLSDADRMNYMQQIIQFLEDPVSLKSMGDCQLSVINIRKIDKDSLDIIFNLDDEITALRTAVNEFRLELGVKVEKALNTADSLKEEYKQLSEQLTKMADDFEKELELHGARMDTIESNVQQQVPRLDAVKENVQSFDTKLQELKTNTDTLIQQQEKKQQEMDTAVTQLSASVALHEAKLGTVEENVQSCDAELKEFRTSTDTVLQKQEKKQQEVDTALTQLSASVALHEAKLGTVEEVMQANKFTQWGNNAGGKGEVNGEGISDCGTSETPTKRRPESDGLRQLKNQTEDKLDTLRRLECIPTTQADEARKLLERKRSILIKGNPGEGKTTMALHLIDNEMYRDRRVLLFVPRHWEKVDTDWVDIIILEDIFGQFDLDGGRLLEWMVHLPTIQEHVDAGKLRVIITTRVDIMSKAYSKIGSLKLFSDDLSLTLSSEKLNHSEKMGILNRELHRNEINMEEDKKVKCITNFRGLIGFPQCCSLFAMERKLFDRGPGFFKSPEKFFVKNITELDGTRFLALAFLFCTGEILEEYLSSETMPEPDKHLLMDLASNLNISKELASIKLLRDACNSFLELYVTKSWLSDFGLMFRGKKPRMEYGGMKPSIRFTHATVCEAVGHVLWDRCPEMVVKHGDSEYLYQKTYTAEDKDSTSQNVFIPVSLYGYLAQRMIHDVVQRGLLRSVVKHSALKQHDFMMKLKDELHKSNKVKKFFNARLLSIYDQFVSKGECSTFMQYMLQFEDVVRLVYSLFLEFLACAHKKNRSGCWKCVEKQTLLVLALYYNHFQIADELFSMNATYTHGSLYTVAKHGDLDRVQAVLETLKVSQVFNPGCEEAKTALCNAYISGNQSLTELLLKESIKLDSKHVVDAVQHGDINILMKVVEHLKDHNKWNPHYEQCAIDISLLLHNIYTCSYTAKIPCLTALYISYCKEKFDMVSYLLKNEVKVSVPIFVNLTRHSSHHAVARAIQDLKVTDLWDPKCEVACRALWWAYWHQKYDVCDLLVQEGVLLSMKNLPNVIYVISLESVKKAIQHLKDTDNWDPKCEDASKAFADAHIHQKYDVCDLLVQEGVSLSMKNLPVVVYSTSLEFVKKAIQHLKDTDKWDPKCEDASKALANAYKHQKYDVCDLFIQEDVSLSMKNLPDVVCSASLESVKKAIQRLKDTDKWDPKCDNVSKAFRNASSHRNYDVCELLVQERVSLKMKNLANGLCSISLESFKKAMKHMKETNSWDSNCEDACSALADAYRHQKYDVCAMLVQEGVSLSMKNLPNVVYREPLEFVKKEKEHSKETDNWDSKCEDASKALADVYRHQKYVVSELLVQENVSLRMKNLPDVVYSASLDSVKKAIQYLKDTDKWDAKCDNVYKAFMNASLHRMHDVCELLFQEGLSLTMKNLPDVVYSVSLESVKKAIEHLKTTDNWDPKCDYASIATANASCYKKHDVYDLLVQEGVLIKRKIFYMAYLTSFEYMRQCRRIHLKWDLL